jgi:hypothetical protein
MPRFSVASGPIRVIRYPYLDTKRGADQTERFDKKVGQITTVTGRQMLEQIAVKHQHRRVSAPLMTVLDPHQPTAVTRWRMPIYRLIEGFVDLSGR